MVRRSVSIPPAPVLTREQLQSASRRLSAVIEAVSAFPVEEIAERSDPRVTALDTRIEEALETAFGQGTVRYNRFHPAAVLDTGPHYMTGYDGRRPFVDHQKYLREGKQQSLLLLQEAYRSIEETLGEISATPDLAPTRPPSIESKAVFIVHGRDEGAKEAVARFLSSLGLTPIILHEQASQGRTIIEKIEAHANVGFAVVLLTPDDLGGLVSEPARPRARQNVLLELGYFVGRLTRSRVCVLKKGDAELPSDWAGVVNGNLDDTGWRIELGKELQAAGYSVDWNKVMS